MYEALLGNGWEKFDRKAAEIAREVEEEVAKEAASEPVRKILEAKMPKPRKVEIKPREVAAALKDEERGDGELAKQILAGQYLKDCGESNDQNWLFYRFTGVRWKADKRGDYLQGVREVVNLYRG